MFQRPVDFFLGLWWLDYGYLKCCKKSGVSHARWITFIEDIFMILDNKTIGFQFSKYRLQIMIFPGNICSDPIKLLCLCRDVCLSGVQSRVKNLRFHLTPLFVKGSESRVDHEFDATFLAQQKSQIWRVLQFHANSFQKVLRSVNHCSDFYDT